MKKWCLVCLVLVAGGCGQPSTAEWLEQLRAKDSSTRLHAVKALATRRGEAEVIVPALAEALKDPEGFVRRDAAAALGGYGTEARQALPALRALLKDRKKDVRRAAARALKEIDPLAAAKAGVR